MERQPLSQDHWHHKTHSPVSTTHASVIGTGLQASGRVYSGGRYRISEAPKFANSRTHKTEPPSPILKYLKVKVSNVKECEYCVTVASELNRRMMMMSSYCVNHMLLCVYWISIGRQFVSCSAIHTEQKCVHFEWRGLHWYPSSGVGAFKVISLE